MSHNACPENKWVPALKETVRRSSLSSFDRAGSTAAKVPASPDQTADSLLARRSCKKRPVPDMGHQINARKHDKKNYRHNECHFNRK